MVGGVCLKLSVIEVPHEEAEEVSVRCHDENAKWVNDIRAVTAGEITITGVFDAKTYRLKLECVSKIP